MIQAPGEVLFELLLDVVDLLIFLVLLVLESVVEGLLESDEVFLFDDTTLLEVLTDRLTQLTVPIESQRTESLRRKLKCCFLLI